MPKCWCTYSTNVPGGQPIFLCFGVNTVYFRAKSVPCQAWSPTARKALSNACGRVRAFGFAFVFAFGLVSALGSATGGAADAATRCADVRLQIMEAFRFQELSEHCEGTQP